MMRQALAQLSGERGCLHFGLGAPRTAWVCRAGDDFRLGHSGPRWVGAEEVGVSQRRGPPRVGLAFQDLPRSQDHCLLFPGLAARKSTCLS